jgi:hypothetical protein
VEFQKRFNGPTLKWKGKHVLFPFNLNFTMCTLPNLDPKVKSNLLLLNYIELGLVGYIWLLRDTCVNIIHSLGFILTLGGERKVFS